MDPHKNAVIGKATGVIWSPSHTLNHSETPPSAAGLRDKDASPLQRENMG